jgi:hypothetical protein
MERANHSVRLLRRGGISPTADRGSKYQSIVAYVAISIPFALLTGFFSWIAPRAKWFIAIAISAPVAIISILSSWSGAYLMLGAI